MKAFTTYLALSLVFGYAGVSHAHHGGVTAYAIPLTGIQIDGDLDDWPEDMIRYPILNYGQVYGPADIDRANSATRAEFSPRFMVGFSLEENLIYLAVLVRGDSWIANVADGWRTDACQVYTDGAHAGEKFRSPGIFRSVCGAVFGSKYRAAVRQYVMYPPSENSGNLGHAKPAANPVLFADISFEFGMFLFDGDPRWRAEEANLEAGDLSTTRTRGMATRAAGGTIYEWALEVFDLYPDSPTTLAVGKTIGFDVVTVDRDRTVSRRAWNCWAPIARRKAWNAALLGDLVLVESYDDLGALAGTVMHAEKKTPYAGLIIDAYRGDQPGGSVQTDATGRFQLRVLPGEYTLRTGRRPGSLAAGRRIGDWLLRGDMVYVWDGGGERLRPFEITGPVVQAGHETESDFVVHPIGIRGGEMVYVSDFGFYIDKHEVTNAEYAAFVQATGHRVPRCGDVAKKDWNIWQGQSPPSGYEKYPVVGVSGYDARAYCAWVGKRLPTQQERQQACHGQDERAYPWGNSEPNGTLANFTKADDGYEFTAPVGSYPSGASPYGALDMAGNVWEWTAAKGGRPMMLGGAWGYGSSFMRCDGKPATSWWGNDIGFRCAR